MPIKPENRHRYPPDWPEIAYRLKEAAGWRCEICGAQHGYEHPVNRATVVLTVMHLDHQPENCDPANLRVACQRCHNRYDAPMRARGRRRRKRQAIEEYQLTFKKELE